MKKRGKKRKKVKIAKVKAKARKIKGKKKKKLKQGRTGRSRTSASIILSILAILLLVLNSIFYFSQKEGLEKNLGEKLAQAGLDVEKMLPIMLNIFNGLAIAWFVFGIALALLVYFSESKKKWCWILAIGILSILALRLLAGIFAILAAIFYKKELQKEKGRR